MIHFIKQKKIEVAIAVALLAFTSSSSFAALEEGKSYRPQRQYKLVRDSDSHRQSLDWLLSHDSTTRGHQLLASAHQQQTALPTSYDIRQSIINGLNPDDKCIFPVYDQGGLGSCTANAAAAALQFSRISQKLSNYRPSRLFIYYNERKDDKSLDVNQDTGASIADAIAAITKYGACPESLWPYNSGNSWPYIDDGVQFTKKPPTSCYAAGLSNIDLDTLAIAKIPQNTNTITAFKAILQKNHPILIGIDVYESLESSSATTTGIIPMPQADSKKSITENFLGGHALMVTGFDDNKQTIDSNGKVTKGYLTIRNSWGASPGDQGYYFLPYAYITTPYLDATTNKLSYYLASDFWSVSSVGTKSSTKLPMRISDVSPHLVPISFTVKNAKTRLGQDVYVSGNTPELGRWDPAKAIKMFCKNTYPTWTVIVPHAAAQTITYKYVKRSGNDTIWMNGSDLSFTIKPEITSVHELQDIWK